MDAPCEDDVRQALAELDERQQKIVAGLAGVMMQNPDQLGDNEWIAHQLTEMAILAGDFEADSANEAVQAVQSFLQEHADLLLRCSLMLFQRVGLDLQPRAAEGFSFEDAMRQALSYLPPS